MHRYTTHWFRSFRESAAQSASVVVPQVLQLTGARSVVDVGCGVGAWLDQYRRHGITDLLGVDGPYVDAEELLLDPRQFISHDLQLPLHLGRTFDLCQCLEVAEHLPSRCADSLIESLTALAPIVFFSAAVPGQGGTHHVNEQWPSYWVTRFEVRGYRLVDALRHRIWNDPRVDYWYAQNAVLFANDAALQQNARLRSAHAQTHRDHVAMVHPQLFEHTAAALHRTWDYRCRYFLRSAWHRVCGGRLRAY
jgi:SAM-dependent methyltransferase